MSKPHETKDFWLASLRAEAMAFAATVAQEGVLDLPVVSCPGWTIADLAAHLAGRYDWIRAHVDRGVTTPPEPPDAFGPPEGMTVVQWWSHARDSVLELLETIDQDLPAWNWAPRPKVAVFWHRRIAHETAVHRWDAQMATGLAEPIEARLAADGVTEVLDTLLPAGHRRGAERRPGVIALEATDLDEVWYVRLRREGIALLDTDTLLDDDDHHERATASGTASDLVLAVYGRVPFDVLRVSGDVGLLDGLRAG